MNRIRLFLGILFVATAVACSGSSNQYDRPGDDSDAMYQQFLLCEKAAEEIDLPVYWLGREFDAGDIQFHGPNTPETVEDVNEEGRLNLTYLGHSGEQVAGLELTVYNRAGWERAKDTVANPDPPPGGGSADQVERRTVTVLGRSAELLSIPGIATHQAFRLVIDLESVVIVAAAPAVGKKAPDGSNYSPFVNDPELLVQVMQDLRVYPK